MVRPEASGIISPLINSIPIKDMNTCIKFVKKPTRGNIPFCHLIVDGLLYLTVNKDKATS